MLYEQESRRPIGRKKAIYSLHKLRELLKLSRSYHSRGVGGQEWGTLSSVHNFTYASKGQMRSQDFHPSKVVKGCPTPLSRWCQQRSSKELGLPFPPHSNKTLLFILPTGVLSEMLSGRQRLPQHPIVRGHHYCAFSRDYKELEFPLLPSCKRAPHLHLGSQWRTSVEPKFQPSLGCNIRQHPSTFTAPGASQIAS